MNQDTPEHTQDVAAPAPTRARALPALSLLVAVLVAAVLQFAAAAKVASGADDLRRIKDSETLVAHGLEPTVSNADFQFLLPPNGTLPRGILLDFAVAAAEFALVVLVLAAHRTRAVWLLVPLVFSTFAGFGVQRFLGGLPCGCFGDLWHPPDGLTIALDVLFVVAGLALAAIRGATGRVLGATLLLSLAGAAGGYVYAAQSAPPKAETVESAPANPRQDSTTEHSTQTTSNPTSTPTFDPSMSAPEKLLASDLMADIRAAHADGEPTVYYVFIWDPTCNVCERLKPIVEFHQENYAAEGNLLLQVLLFKKQDLLNTLGIEKWEWESSPVVFAVRDGAVVELPGGDDSPMPDDILARLTAGEPITDE